MKQHRRASRKLSILAVFIIFIAVAMSFVSWLIYAVFAENYRDIKQQYYAVVSGNIVENIENSVKNGKQIDRFYGMDNELTEMLDLITTETVTINAAVTDTEGNILYSSVATSADRDAYYAMLNHANVRSNVLFPEGDTTQYKMVNSGEYDVMLQPIFDQNGNQIGAMSLFYHSDDIEKELTTQKQSSNLTTAICIGVVILTLIIYMAFLPRSITEERETEGDGSHEEAVKAYTYKQNQNRFMFLVPVAIIMVGLLVQCVLSYNSYQQRYKEVMFEGAAGISSYLGDMTEELHNKGVSYERMYGLDEYFAEKVEDSPLLWSINVVKVYADTSDITGRDSEYTVSSFLKNDGDANERVCINVEVSKAYIDDKMQDMLLMFVASYAVALIMIYELLKLPDVLFKRVSKHFHESKKTQAEIAAPVLRLGMFIAYTGMYVGIPFSGVMISQWNQSVFGLSVGFLASIPMTAELLATMLCSLLLLPLFKKLPLRGLFTGAVTVSVAANVLCFLAGSPVELILLRFVSGMGLAGFRYCMNTIVAQGSTEDGDTTANLAALNAGLLGGITCGGTLGAIIAGAIGIQTAYLISAILLVLFGLIVLGFAPWKLVKENGVENASVKVEDTDKVGKAAKSGILSHFGDLSLWRYLLLVAVPMNFGLMFVVAFFPNFVSSMGLPDVVTSYGYLINGLVGIYIGPKLLSALSQKLGRSACVVLALLLGAASVFVFNVDLPLVMVLVCVALLGLFDGFGTPATSAYYVNLPIIKHMGVSKGLTVLSVVGSIVQTASPVVYSVILSTGLYGTNTLGIVFVGCALLFLFSLRMGKSKTRAAAESAE